MAGGALGHGGGLCQRVLHGPANLGLRDRDIGGPRLSGLGVGHVARRAAGGAEVPADVFRRGPEMAGRALLAEEVEENVAALLERREWIETGHGAVWQQMTIGDDRAWERGLGRHRELHVFAGGLEAVGEERAGLRARAMGHD